MQPASATPQATQRAPGTMKAARQEKRSVKVPATSAADTYYALQFAPDGVISPAAAKLAVATTTVTNGLPQFTNAGAVRGLAFRTSGAVTRVNEPGSF